MRLPFMHCEDTPTVNPSEAKGKSSNRPGPQERGTGGTRLQFLSLLSISIDKPSFPFLLHCDCEKNFIPVENEP